eukprot:12740828-Alexandrium_andersonii.AAC.1
MHTRPPSPRGFLRLNPPGPGTWSEPDRSSCPLPSWPPPPVCVCWPRLPLAARRTRTASRSAR